MIGGIFINRLFNYLLLTLLILLLAACTFTTNTDEQENGTDNNKTEDTTDEGNSDQPKDTDDSESSKDDEGLNIDYDIEISLSDLTKQFNEDPAKAKELYDGKVIVFTTKQWGEEKVDEDGKTEYVYVRGYKLSNTGNMFTDYIWATVYFKEPQKVSDIKLNNAMFIGTCTIDEEALSPIIFTDSQHIKN